MKNQKIKVLLRDVCILYCEIDIPFLLLTAFGLFISVKARIEHDVMALIGLAGLIDPKQTAILLIVQILLFVICFIYAWRFIRSRKPFDGYEKYYEEVEKHNEK
ncbi:MAG: hypothetical protein K2H82_07325 [Oscillospiraceae bacterium]|nr:hypothetical protein [Oscillospiraceae bacterium]